MSTGLVARGSIAALLMILWTSKASGQTLGDIGLALELGETDSAPSVMGGLEFAFSPRVSLRPSFMWTKERADRRVTVSWDVIHAWILSETWRPFVSGGVGFHLFRSRGAIDDNMNFGASFGMGVERTWPKARISLISELQYFIVEQGATRSPSAMSARVGLKRMF